MNGKTLKWVGVVSSLFLIAILVCALVPMASAQETTGGIKALVKDKTGAVVPGATVELSGPALITPRTLTADDAGYVFFDQVPPGVYTLSATAPNFRTFKVTGIKVDVGKAPTFDLALELGEVSQTMEVTSTAVLIDVTSSKVSTAIPQDVIDNIPKGRSYQSVISLAPGARQEPLQSSRVDRFRANGFQIDGASDSENTYLVEGLDTSNIQSGGVKQNVPFEFVQEVQVKSSSYEAEYGGAMGGVVNVVQKRGTDQWHGSVVTYYHPDAFDANDQCATTPQTTISESVLPSAQQIQCGQRADPSTSINTTTRTDQPMQYYRQAKDHYFTVEPGYEVGGPLLKGKLSFFSSYIPSITRTTRTVNYTFNFVNNANPSTSVLPGPRTFTQSVVAQNALNRLDYQLFRTVHLFAGWQYGYSRITGQLPATPDSLNGLVNANAGSNPNSTVLPALGSVNPSNILTFGGDWTVNSHTVVTARYGYFYYDTQERNRPNGTRFLYATQTALNPTVIGLDGNPLVTASSPFVGSAGFASMASNTILASDVFSRKEFSTDVSYFANKWGTHNFKVGYGFNRLFNDVFQTINGALVELDWGISYQPQTTTGNTNCTAIQNQNNTTYGAGASAKGCRGNAGYFKVQDGTPLTQGTASSYNHGIYVQDNWTVGHGLTLNIGVRLEHEFVPPYIVQGVAGPQSITFDWGSKVAPRIGGAYDLFHNGKLKIFASYGKFYDTMKYSLPRGSFGGEYWHECAYAMDFVDYSTITPVPTGGHTCSGSPSAPAPGVTVGRFIENFDFRLTASSPNDPTVDPNIKPMSQHEFVVGGDWAITPTLGLEVRYARKRLDNAIEDMALTDTLSGFYIGNPGPNTFADLLQRALPASGISAPTCPTCPLLPTAQRRYDGIETRLNYRRSNLFGQLSYTYSRLTGNYSGLTDTDVTDGNGGRHNPNNHRDFDDPAMEFTTTGKVMDGRLSTDRPHVLAMTGYYRLKWLGMESTFGANQVVSSGTPESTCMPINNSSSSCQYWGDQRGTIALMHRDAATGNFVLDGVQTNARTPLFSQTDFNFGHSFHVSKSNEAMRLGFEWNVLNLFNQDSILAINPDPLAGSTTTTSIKPRTASGAVDFMTLMTGWDPIKGANGTAYNVPGTQVLANRYLQPFLFQNRRAMRMAVRFTF
jgi:outer membrane receptor protein involved in Fe transport